jgi:hypothetical protein
LVIGILTGLTRIAFLLALGSGLSQGMSVVAGYVTGTDGRMLAVFALLAAASLIAAAPLALAHFKKSCISPESA